VKYMNPSVPHHDGAGWMEAGTATEGGAGSTGEPPVVVHAAVVAPRRARRGRSACKAAHVSLWMTLADLCGGIDDVVGRIECGVADCAVTVVTPVVATTDMISIASNVARRRVLST
jgi:hypothetical protein